MNNRYKRNYLFLSYPKNSCNILQDFFFAIISFFTKKHIIYFDMNKNTEDWFYGTYDKLFESKEIFKKTYSDNIGLTRSVKESADLVRYRQEGCRG